MNASTISSVTPGTWRNQPSARSMPSFSSSCVMISMSQPTSLRRQPHVLAAPADGQRQLIFLDEHDGPPQPRVEEHFLDLGRLQGVGDQHLQRVVPADDVDALAAQFIDDVLDAAAAHADAGADAIDLHVDAGDGDLGAVAGLAGHRLDLDGAVA